MSGYIEGLRGADAGHQAAVDKILLGLDGTPNKAARRQCHHCVSVAAAHAAAAAHGVGSGILSGGNPGRLPLPEIQISAAARTRRSGSTPGFTFVAPRAKIR